MYKLIIIGSGPAGYTAGIYSSRAQLKPILISGEKPGGQLVNTSIVENWPGADEGIWGADLMLKLKKQAEKFGTKIIDKKVTRVDFSQKPLKVYCGEEVLEAKAIIIATGADDIKLNVPGEKELMGKGVAVCAVCDAAFYKDKIALVVGGGDAACEDALALTKFASQIYLVVRRDELRASKIMADRVKNHPKIKILWQSQVKEILGINKVEAVKLTGGIRPLKSDKDNHSLNGIRHSGIDEMVMEVDGVFLAIGHKPNSEIFKGQVGVDEKGFIKTGIGYLTMTSVDGVFAAGDVVDYRYKQAVTAAGMGCQAALDAEKWLEEKNE